jgi:predicted ATPase
LTHESALDRIGPLHRYHRRVFFAPPWPEIYATDAERRHGLDSALVEYDRLLRVYPSLGYEVITLPKVGVSERADFVLHTLELVSKPPAGGRERGRPAGRGGRSS